MPTLGQIEYYTPSASPMGFESDFVCSTHKGSEAQHVFKLSQLMDDSCKLTLVACIILCDNWISFVINF